MKTRWKEYLSVHPWKAVAMAGVFAVFLYFLYRFLGYVECRNGVVLDDPLLAIIPSYDVSVPLFFITYAASLAGVGYVIRDPALTFYTLLSYMLIHTCRIVCMFFTPLDPPSAIIPLRDFFLEGTFYAGHVNVKDLFFSGHTATMFLFFMVIENKKIKYIYLLLTIAVAILLLIQHAHYTIDILMALLVVWFSCIMAKKMKIFWDND